MSSPASFATGRETVGHDSVWSSDRGLGISRMKLTVLPLIIPIFRAFRLRVSAGTVQGW